MKEQKINVNIPIFNNNKGFYSNGHYFPKEVVESALGKEIPIINKLSNSDSFEIVGYTSKSDLMNDNDIVLEGITFKTHKSIFGGEKKQSMEICVEKE